MIHVSESHCWITVVPFLDSVSDQINYTLLQRCGRIILLKMISKPLY